MMAQGGQAAEEEGVCSFSPFSTFINRNIEIMHRYFY
jgi:hypothetical protein